MQCDSQYEKAKYTALTLFKVYFKVLTVFSMYTDSSPVIHKTFVDPSNNKKFISN